MKRDLKTNKKLVWEIAIILVCFIGILFSLLQDFNIIKIPTGFTTKIKDKENLFLTLFTVQASVATVSIAIVSIITGLINEYVLGVSISGFITNIKPYILKHNRLIIANLIITMLNYISLSFALFNSCIVLFFISGLITILLIKEIYLVFLGKNKLRIEIENYVLLNYQKNDILENLNKELFSAIETGNSLIVNDDLKIIKNIFEKECERSNCTQTDIVAKLSTIVADAFNKITLKNSSQKSTEILNFICEIYKIANKNKEKPLHLDVWYNIRENYFRCIKELNFEQIIDNGACFILHGELCKNLQGENAEQLENSDLKYYSGWLYSVLIEKGQMLNENEKRRITRDIYDILHGTLFYRNFSSSNEYLSNLLTQEMCNFLKHLIDCGDSESIKKLFFEHARHDLGNKYGQIIFIVIVLYLYYLAARESMIEGKELQTLSRKILSENNNKIAFFYLHVDIYKFLSGNLVFVRKILSNWEYMEEGKAKWMVMDHVVEDFFIFISLGKFWDKKLLNDTIAFLAPSTMFSLYDRYFSRDNGTSVKSLFLEFESLINKEKDEKFIVEKISILNDVFNERYKNETLKEGEERKITQEQKEWFSLKAKECVDKVIKNELSSFAFRKENNENCITISKERSTICICTLSEYFFNEKTFDETIKDHIAAETITTFINSIFKNLEFKNISYKDKNKQATLIELVETHPIKPDTVIGNRDEFWDEKVSDELAKYTKEMKKIKFSRGYNYYFILDSSLIEFAMENICVEFVDLTWDDIKDKCKENENGELKYNVTNDIYIPFSKNEIEQYVFNTEKKIIIYADITARLKKEKVGAGIKICIDED